MNDSRIRTAYPDIPVIECTQLGAFDVNRGGTDLSRIVIFILKPGTSTTITHLGGCATTTMVKPYLANDPIW